MRLVILADIHGNLAALEAVLADAQPYDPGGIVVAGDTTGGAQSQECLDRLRALGAQAIRGNNEEYMLAYHRGDAPPAWRASRRWGAMRWCYHHLRPETLGYLAALPAQRVVAVDGRAPIRVVHGSPQSAYRHLVPDGNEAALAHFRRVGIVAVDGRPLPLAEALAGVAEPVLVCGHSHLAWQQRAGDRLALNPGSVGSPANGDWRAQYALLTWEDGDWQVEFRAVAYDRARMRAAFVESGYLAAGNAFARACMVGADTGLNVPGALVDHAIRLAKEEGWTWDDMPDAVWDRAAETFDWPLLDGN